MDGTWYQRHRLFQIRWEPAVTGGSYRVVRGCAGSPRAETVACTRPHGAHVPERLVFYADRSGSEVLFVLRAGPSSPAREAVYEVVDGRGAVIGSVEKDSAVSLARSRWRMCQAGGLSLTGRERRASVAILRHVWGARPFSTLPQPAWRYHVDFVTDVGERALHVDRAPALHDGYVLDIASAGVDRRLAIAQAVALDALRAR